MTPGSYDLVVIGCSLGGMRALEGVFKAFPDDFSTPIAVAQHRHKKSNDSLPASLLLPMGEGLLLIAKT